MISNKNLNVVWMGGCQTYPERRLSASENRQSAITKGESVAVVSRCVGAGLYFNARSENAVAWTPRRHTRA